MSKKTISTHTKKAGFCSSLTPAKPRKGRKERASVVTPEKKGKGLAHSSDKFSTSDIVVTMPLSDALGLLRLANHFVGESICASCALCNIKGCPMNWVPKRYDLVVWVEECDQWRPRK